ncbi:uncharacterized protein LOC130810368 [Amaranthus tricolor]|uniref:uncharacterized protein LOC130810368 n=1 Tax=Amaranthus tricolor TaxID=29722 RepID=UPI002589AD9A|nr:uncharacterized protein LOC130810368 [Amaranthus tricolor]
MADEEEVRQEVELVEAVYGDDCIILNTFPPHLHLHLKPLTAEVHSQQFVEATIELRADLQYPSDPPYVDIIGSKGLDENRKNHLKTSLLDKAREMTSFLMLVTLCEKAVEVLTSMNHPEGDCPLCLYPLVPEDKDSEAQPFMKLMSCFHCFHCDCIVRWLKWLQKQNESYGGMSSILSSSVEENDSASDFSRIMGDSTGNCPVCRKVFLAKDIEHVLSLVVSYDADSDVCVKELMEQVLQYDQEISRRQKFETILELQQQHGGLIEPPKDNVLFSRLSLQDLVTEDAEVVNEQQQNTNQVVVRERSEASSSYRTRQTRKHHHRGHTVMTGPSSSAPPVRSTVGQHRYYRTKKHGRNYSRTQATPTPQKE